LLASSDHCTATFPSHHARQEKWGKGLDMEARAQATVSQPHGSSKATQQHAASDSYHFHNKLSVPFNSRTDPCRPPANQNTLHPTHLSTSISARYLPVLRGLSTAWTTGQKVLMFAVERKKIRERKRKKEKERTKERIKIFMDEAYLNIRLFYVSFYFYFYFYLFFCIFFFWKAQKETSFHSSFQDLWVIF
jgi:hypothetical protein